MMETFFPETVGSGNDREYLLWRRFEEALGKFDTEGIFAYSTEDIQIDYDHAMRDTAVVEDVPEQEFRSLSDEMQETFEAWVSSNNHLHVRPRSIPLFDASGLFLSFNYTDTLESVYGVAHSQIAYIHGNASRGDRLIVGHCNHVAEIRDDDMPLYEENSRNSIIRQGNAQAKDTAEAISRHLSFFQMLHQQVDAIVVYGHSLAMVDDPYFAEVIGHTGKFVPWYFSWHTQADQSYIQDFVRRHVLPPATIHLFNM